MLLAFEQLDRVVDQIGVEVLDLLLAQLDVLERVDDLVVGEEPLLLALLDELVELFDVWKGDLDVEQSKPRFPRGLTGGPATPKSRTSRSGSAHRRRILVHAITHLGTGPLPLGHDLPRPPLHGCSPTGRHRARPGRVRAGAATRRGRAARRATFRPPTLSARPVPSGETAQRRPSAPPFADPARRCVRISTTSACERAADQIRPSAHRRGRRARRPSSVGRRANALAIRSSGSANVGTPQPSMAMAIVAASTSAAAATSAWSSPLKRMLRQAVAARRPARARGRRAGSRRACPSSCARSASAPDRTRGRPRRSRRAIEQAIAPPRAVPAAPDGRRRRSRSPRRRCPVAPARAAAPAAAWRRSGGT